MAAHQDHLNCFYIHSHPDELYAERPSHTMWYVSTVLHAALWSAVVGLFLLIVVVLRRFYFLCQYTSSSLTADDIIRRQSPEVYRLDQDIAGETGVKYPLDRV